MYFHQDDAGDEQNDIHAYENGTVETVVEVDGQGILMDVTDDGRYLLYGSDEGTQLNLYRYNVESGERSQLTEYDQPVWGGGFGPDDQQIAYVANESDSLENRDVYAMDADGADKRRLDIGEDGHLDIRIPDLGPADRTSGIAVAFALSGFDTR